MTYRELKETFCDLKQKTPKDNLTAHVIFTEDSFAEPYPLLSRTYRVSSDNKGYWPRMFSRSIFAYCLDVTSDQGVRLDWHMAEEGNPGGWKVEDCYILERMQDADAIPSLTWMEQNDGSVCYFSCMSMLTLGRTGDRISVPSIRTTLMGSRILP